MSKKETNKNLLDIGELIREGTDYNEIIEVETKGRVFSAKIRPATINEWNNAQREEKRTGKVGGLTLVSLCLTDLEGNTFDKKTLEKALPAGVIGTIFKEIARISGFDLQEEKIFDKAIEQAVKDF